MFQSTFHRQTSRWTLIHWFLLSFLAGNLNAGGYLACHRFVSHVTGFFTLAGIDLAIGRFDHAIGLFAVPLFFLLGVMTSAYLVDRRVQTGRRPRYPAVMGLVAICLAFVIVMGEFKLFGEFGERIRMRKDFIFMALLCTAAGLQNAAITTSSGSTVRTTHLTGPITDLGIGIIRILSYPKGSELAEDLKAASYMKVGQIFSFLFGSLCGAVLFLRFQYLGFLLPFTLALYIMFLAHRGSRSPTARPKFYREGAK